MTDGLDQLGEFGLISRLTGDLHPQGAVRLGIGDDCAEVEVGDTSLLLTCDASLEDVHFHRDWGTPEDIGWKAAVSALSDIAAMGGRANYLLVTLALPDDLDLGWVEAAYRGIREAASFAGAQIVGGDTTGSRSGVVLDFSVVGEVVGRAVRRDGAKPGDLLAMTGGIGARGAGLHALLHDFEAPELVKEYLRPFPRLVEGRWLQSQDAVHAMMDVSDGLLPDARHIARSSGVGINLHGDRLPAHAAVERFWTDLGENPAAKRLRSGEEYELLIAVERVEAAALRETFLHTFEVPLTFVGECTDGHEGVMIDGEPVEDGGFEHFRPPH